MPLHARNVLMFVSDICHVRKVSPYIPLPVNSSTTLVNRVLHNVSHVHRPTCVSFKSIVSVTSNYKYVSLSPLYAVLVVILFRTFSLAQSAKAVSVCNIFSTYCCIFMNLYSILHEKC